MQHNSSAIPVPFENNQTSFFLVLATSLPAKTTKLALNVPTTNKKHMVSNIHTQKTHNRIRVNPTHSTDAQRKHTRKQARDDKRRQKHNRGK